MKNLKMNVAEENLLNAKEMNSIVGGSCGCACNYEESGGSSTADNNSANNAEGKHSPGMEHITAEMNEDGSWTLCDKWR